MEVTTLPVGMHPGWEHDASNGSDDSEGSEDETQQFRSVADSLVVSQSLRQSRNRWLSSAFPKFSAKARGGKPPEVVPPPHSIKAHGRFDVRIGPHIFPDTTFYEVYYLPDIGAGRETSSGQAPTFHAPRAKEPQRTDVLPSTAQVAVSALSSSPEVRKDFSDSSVTPDLVLQVSTAAATDPVLKDLLQLAGSDKASPEQKKTLADLIRSMGAASNPISLQSPPAGTSAHASVIPSRSSAPLRRVHDFDIVIEFQEKPSDRWIVPRGSAACERLNTHPLSDILLSISIPASEHLQAESPEKADETMTPQIVNMRISNVSLGLWELLFRWVGGEEGIAKGRDALRNIADRQPPRTYLQYQLPDGPLLEQLKNTVPPRYNMKSIMPTNSNSTRNRKKPARKHREAKAQATGTTVMSIVDGKHKSKARAIEPAAPISCRSCGRADVPLLNFGRYCKNCINTSRSNGSIVAPPQAYASSSPSIAEPRASAKPMTAVAPPQAYAKSPSAVTPYQAYANAASPAYQPWPYAGYNSYSVALPATTPSSSQTTLSTRDYKPATATATAAGIVPVVVQASHTRTASHSEPRVTTDDETMDLT